MSDSRQKEPINVAEYSESDETIFTETELRILRTEFKGRLMVAPTFTGCHVIRTQQYVGTFVLPNHIKLVLFHR